MPLIIRPENTSDRDAIREVNRKAFAQEDEGRLVDALRDGGFVRLSLVAQDEKRVVGHILFSDLPIITDTGTVSALALAPMAVLTECQRQGIGRRDGCADQGRPCLLARPSQTPHRSLWASAAAADRAR